MWTPRDREATVWILKTPVAHRENPSPPGCLSLPLCWMPADVCSCSQLGLRGNEEEPTGE